MKLHVRWRSWVWGLLMKSNRVRRASPVTNTVHEWELQCGIWAFAAERAVVNWHRSFLCILHEGCCLSRPFSLTRSLSFLSCSMATPLRQQNWKRKEMKELRHCLIKSTLHHVPFRQYPEFIMISEKRCGICCGVPFLVMLSLFFSSSKHIYALIIQAALKMKTHH